MPIVERKAMGLRFKVDGLPCLYFITTTVIEHIRILTDKPVAKIILENLNFYRSKYNFRLNAYVIMPSHIHLLLNIPETCSVSDITRDFKKFTSSEIRDHLIRVNSKFLPIFLSEGKKYPRQNFKLWMERSDKVAIVSRKILEIKLNYIHQNPVRAGLVEKAEYYLYSSASDYTTGKKGPIVVDKIEW